MPPPARLAQIQEMLAADPADEMLRYMLGMEYVSLGDDATAVETFNALIADTNYVPAYLMAGQALVRLDRIPDACAVLKTGVAAATRAGNGHAAGEMQGLLDSIE